MSHYIRCPQCREETLDVDTLRCDCGHSEPLPARTDDEPTRSEEIRFYVYHALAGTAQPEGWWATRDEAQDVCDGLNISHACPVYEVRAGGPL